MEQTEKTKDGLLRETEAKAFMVAVELYISIALRNFCTRGKTDIEQIRIHRAGRRLVHTSKETKHVCHDKIVQKLSITSGCISKQRDFK